MKTKSITIHFSNGETKEYMPKIPRPQSGNLYKMLRLWDVEGPNPQGDTDQEGAGWTPTLGAFSGVSNFFFLDDQKERDLIERVNTGVDSIPWSAKLHWSVWSEAGGIYRAERRDDMFIPWKDTSLFMGSRSALPGEYNLINVLSIENGYLNTETIPILQSYDHLSPETHPWLFHRIYVTNTVGKTYETPAGIFYKPLFSPIGRRRAAGEITGFYCRPQYVGSKIQ